MLEMLQTHKHNVMAVSTKIFDKTGKWQKFHLILKKKKKICLICLFSLTIWKVAIEDTLALQVWYAYAAKYTHLCKQF